jgi:Fic family protein
MDPVPIEFSANYRRYPPEMLTLLVRIAQALGAIRGARVLPAVADQLRATAKAGTVHFSNLIEGNELPFVAAERAARRQLDTDTRAKIELVNYVEALDLIDERSAAGTLELTPDSLKELHGTVMRGLGRGDDPHFKPHHEGEWRDGAAMIVDRISGQIMFEAPPKDEVPGRMEGMFDWLERKLASHAEQPFVVAGVMHYGITDVHPFADGNGRVARLCQTALLMKLDVLPGRMFSFEGYYAGDREAYYDALRSVRRRTLNMEFWLEYFLRGMAEEYERIAATIDDLSSLLSVFGGEPLRLTASMQRGLANLRIAGRREFTRREYEQAASVGRTSAHEDLKQLVRHGVLSVRGATSSTRYSFATGTVQMPSNVKSAGRPKKWNDTVIEVELRAFLDGRSGWPARTDFIEAGRRDLYAAASRSGGIARWRQIFGM